MMVVRSRFEESAPLQLLLITSTYLHNKVYDTYKSFLYVQIRRYKQA